MTAQHALGNCLCQPTARKSWASFLALAVTLSAQSGTAQSLRFEDVTERAGVIAPTDPNGYGHGVAVADFNGDGLPDIYVISYEADNSLFMNNGDGSFTDRAREAGVHAGSAHDRGIAAADYDNDGDVDFFIASGAGSNKLLYVNEGRGSFFDFAQGAGLRVSNFQGQGVSWGDYDNDGNLDLALPSFEHSSRLFRQHTGGTFTEATEQAGIVYSDNAVQSAFFDFDLDGDLDLMISRGAGSPNRFFVNHGNGAFVDEATERNIADPDPHGQGLAVADYDGDGDLDVYLSNANGPNRLYRNDGGRFAEVGRAAGVDDPSRSLGCMFADFDNDGWPDLYVGNFGRNRIYHNNGDGTFKEVSAGSGADVVSRAYGTSVLDYDADGRMDIYFSSSGEPSHLLRNLGPANHWLKISLTGKRSNRNGIGSRIVLTSGGRRQLQQLLAGSSMVSGGNDLMFHFGLGAATRADKIEVYWPSGERDVLQNVAANQALTIQEGSHGVPPADTTAPRLAEIIVETASHDIATISWSTDEPASAQVEYGLTASYGNLTPVVAAAAGLHHTVRITELRGDEIYHFRVLSADAAGNLAVSADQTFNTPPAVLPPTIRLVQIENITGHSAEISWHTTKNTTCWIEYGVNTDYGQQQAASSSDGLQHRVKLERLASSTPHHFRITARHDKNRLVRSRDYSFVTLFEADTARPAIFNISAREIGTHEAKIVWETDEAATGQVEYGLSPAYGQTAETDSLQTQHELALTGLAPHAWYHFRVHARDAAGNAAVSADFTFQTLPEADTTPPNIYNIAVWNVTTGGATISWQTDEEANSRVDYGYDANYGEAVQRDGLRTYHEIELGQLEANTTYHFRVHSRDAAGNPSVSQDASFTTQRSSGGGTITDDFNRSDIGPDWTLDGRYWEIRNGELGHTSEATGSWRYLAVFNRISNGGGTRITEVSYRWGQNVDAIGVREGAMALMLDGNSAHASGYWIWHRYNQVWLWTIVNGEYVGGIDLGHWNGRSDPVAGDVVTVVIREEAEANYFDYYINGGYSATAVDPAKHFPRSDTWYAGVFMRGEGVHNECDDFSVTYAQGAQRAPVISGIRAVEIGSSSASLSWTTTIASHARVEYRLAESTEWRTQASESPATAHAIVLSGLLPGRSYRYRIVAKSAAGLSAASVEHQFVTKPDNGDLANNVEMLGFLGLSGSPTLGNVWGYADSSGEYALVCLRQNGLAIVDVTAARAPQYVAGVSSFYNDLKDVKTYNHYAVAVNEFGPVQIIDLANPRQPELVAMYDASFRGGHNLFVAGHYAYVVGTHPLNAQEDEPTGLHVLDLSNPLQPRLAGKREDFYIHDLFVENDTAYVLGYRSHQVQLWDVRDKQNMRTLAVFPYRSPHTVRRGARKNILVVNDEARGQNVQFWNIGDHNHIHQVGSYMTDPLTAPHCIEIIGNLAYIAYFEDMLRIVDYTDPAAPVEVGVYDTYPENPSNGQPPGAHQTAAWGVYPHTPSGNIYLSDMRKGLYIFRYVPPGPAKNHAPPKTASAAMQAENPYVAPQKNLAKSAIPALPQAFGLSNYPNPLYAARGTRIRLQLPQPAAVNLTVFDLLGKTVKEIAAENYPAGVVDLHWRGDHFSGGAVAQGVYILRMRFRRQGDASWSQLVQRVLVLP